MKTNFGKIYEINEHGGELFVRWNDRSNTSYNGDEKEAFMRQYRIWLAQQDRPGDRICDLDRTHPDGCYSRDIENENKRKMMSSDEREKFDRSEDNIDGVLSLMNVIATLQEKTQIYVDEVVQFQKDTVKAMQDSRSFLLAENVSKWELKRMESLVKETTNCREVGKKINALTLMILEDWII